MTPVKDIKKKSAPESGSNRRNFIVSTAGGFTLGFFLPSGENRAEAATLFGGDPTELAVNSWIRIIPDDPNNYVTIMFGGCELGQGSMTGLAQILAEDLMADWNLVRVEQALGDASSPAVSPFSNDKVVTYPTGGSSAIRNRFVTLRRVGATAREMLIAAAMADTTANGGGGSRDKYYAKNNVVYRNDSSASWTFAKLAAKAAKQDSTLQPPQPFPVGNNNFRIIGTPVNRVDIPLKVNGSAVFGIDVQIPGMVYASVKHCPTIGGTVSGTPRSGQGTTVIPLFATDSRGVIVGASIPTPPPAKGPRYAPIPANYTAVAVALYDTTHPTATYPNANTWAAVQAAQSAQVTWSIPTGSADIDSAKMAATGKALLDNDVVNGAHTAVPAWVLPGTPPENQGYPDKILSDPTVTVLTSNYTVPYLAHACMEVVNCTVNLTATACEVWAPTQSAAGAVKLISNLTGLPYSAITVHTTFLGGGLGRKIELDFVSQAVQVAMAIKKPVKLVWPRSEDFTHDQYRPGAWIRVSAGYKAKDSTIYGWKYRTVTQSIGKQRGNTNWDGQTVEGAVALHYSLPDRYTEFVPHPAPVPVAYWRSVGASMNCFVVESMIDELANAAVVDPIVFRKSLLLQKGDKRALHVVDIADQKSLWRNSLPKGHAWGIAFGEAFATQVCHVVEISAPSTTSITVHRVTTVVDCGIMVNPNQIEAQMQGSIVHGMGAALYGQITFANGVPSVTNFNKYRMVRGKEMPVVDVSIIQGNLNQGVDPNTLQIGGIGEPGVPPIAPAIANAYFRLTGIRQRSLPFFPGSTMSDG